MLLVLMFTPVMVELLSNQASVRGRAWSRSTNIHHAVHMNTCMVARAPACCVIHDTRVVAQLLTLQLVTGDVVVQQCSTVVRHGA